MVLTSTHNLWFEQKYEEYQNFLSENFHFLVVKFSVYLNRHVFVMKGSACTNCQNTVWDLDFLSFLSGSPDRATDNFGGI